MGHVAELHTALSTQAARLVVGQAEPLRLILIALTCEGHILLEGVPGLAKTTLARCVALSLGLGSRRVQFTPDLMPSDILGTQVFSFQEGNFRLVEGPVFTNILIADEINRSPAKTQSALLEAMQERQVSLDGTPRPLPRPFMVIATQNPIEHEGTYRLPEAQLDRFLFLARLDYPSAEEETRMLAQHRGDSAGQSELFASIERIAGAEELAAARREVLAVRVDEGIVSYIVELVRRTREHPNLELGASPRATLYLQVAARAAAALEGRDYVVPDDVKGMLVPLLRHRVRLTTTAEVEGAQIPELLRGIADGVAVPR